MRGLRTTHTFAGLEVSQPCYDEIARKLRAAGYSHAFMDDGAIDMHGIGLMRAEEPEACIACAEPLYEGQKVYSDASGGEIHAACCGPERESYTGPDGEPLKEGDPIPEPAKYEAP